jgi:SOS response regulatory protein OraA/RecX
VDRVLDEVYARAGGGEVALRAARAYLRTRRDVDRARLYRHLLSRGFLPDEIEEVSRTAREDAADDEEMPE